MRKTGKKSSRRKVLNFFACLLVVMDLTSWPRFFVGAVIGPISWPLFVGTFVGLAIGRAILTGREVAVGFSGLSLW